MRSRLCAQAVLCLAIPALLAPGLSAGQVSSGTGFFVNEAGYLVTNYHVIEGGTELMARTVKGDVLRARVVAIDQANDLALLKVPGRFQALHVRPSSDLRRGTEVLTVGFPQISIQGVEPKVTQGIISALSGVSGDPRFLQIQVPIQPGNSGGPLLMRDGSVVGVVTGRLNSIAVLKATGSLPEGVSYAIKSNYLLELLNSAAQTESIVLRRPPATARLAIIDVVAQVEQSVALVLVTKPTVQVSPEPSPKGSEAPPPVARKEADPPQYGRTQGPAATGAASDSPAAIGSVAVAYPPGTTSRCASRIDDAIVAHGTGDGDAHSRLLDVFAWCQATRRDSCRTALVAIHHQCQLSGSTPQGCAGAKQAAASACAP